MAEHGHKLVHHASMLENVALPKKLIVCCDGENMIASLCCKSVDLTKVLGATLTILPQIRYVKRWLECPATEHIKSYILSGERKALIRLCPI